MLALSSFLRALARCAIVPRAAVARPGSRYRFWHARHFGASAPETSARERSELPRELGSVRVGARHGARCVARNAASISSSPSAARRAPIHRSAGAHTRERPRDEGGCVQPPPQPALRVIRRRTRLDIINNRRLRREIQRGQWVRITRGSFVSGEKWRALSPLAQHRAFVDEIAGRMLQPRVMSHRAAAALLGIDMLGAWPTQVDVTTERASGGRSGGAIRRYALGLEGVDRVPYGRHEVTTAAQTALDLARTLPFVNAVTAVDQALWARRPGGALTTTATILRLMDAAAPRRGDVRARRVIEFATHLSDSVRESQSRVVLFELGFPAPRLQERRVLPSGRIAYADFYFPEEDHWCEFDGKGKYLSPDLLDGRSPSDVVIDEKNRENEIRRIVRAFSRWERADVDYPARLYDILTADGLRSRFPRP